MKRMYVTLGLMLLVAFWAGTLLGQGSRPVDDKEDISMAQRMKMREEMHRRMMDKLINGVGPDQDMFQDMEKFLDEVMADSFSGFHSFSRTTSQNYKMNWEESTKGRTLTIIPKNKDQVLDINVQKGLIEIKGKTEVKTQNGTSVSQFSNSFNVPGDCDPTKLKMDQKNGNIVMFFPFYSERAAVKVRPAPEERKPIPKSETDVQI